MQAKKLINELISIKTYSSILFLLMFYSVDVLAIKYLPSCTMSNGVFTIDGKGYAVISEDKIDKDGKQILLIDSGYENILLPITTNNVKSILKNLSKVYSTPEFIVVRVVISNWNINDIDIIKMLLNGLFSTERAAFNIQEIRFDNCLLTAEIFNLLDRNLREYGMVVSFNIDNKAYSIQANRYITLQNRELIISAPSRNQMLPLIPINENSKAKPGAKKNSLSIDKRPSSILCDSVSLPSSTQRFPRLPTISTTHNRRSISPCHPQSNSNNNIDTTAARRMSLSLRNANTNYNEAIPDDSIESDIDENTSNTNGNIFYGSSFENNSVRYNAKLSLTKSRANAVIHGLKKIPEVHRVIIKNFWFSSRGGIIGILDELFSRPDANKIDEIELINCSDSGNLSVLAEVIDRLKRAGMQIIASESKDQIHSIRARRYTYLQSDGLLIIGRNSTTDIITITNEMTASLKDFFGAPNPKKITGLVLRNINLEAINGGEIFSAINLPTTNLTSINVTNSSIGTYAMLELIKLITKNLTQFRLEFSKTNLSLAKKVLSTLATETKNLTDCLLGNIEFDILMVTSLIETYKSNHAMLSLIINNCTLSQDGWAKIMLAIAGNNLINFQTPNLLILDTFENWGEYVDLAPRGQKERLLKNEYVAKFLDHFKEKYNQDFSKVLHILLYGNVNEINKFLSNQGISCLDALDLDYIIKARSALISLYRELHATTVNIDDEINSEQAMISIRSSSDGRCISTTTINKLDKQLNRLVKKKRLLEEEAEFVLVNRPNNNLESPNEKEQKEKDEDEDKPVQQASLNQNAVSNLNSSESEPPINTDLSNQQSISKASQSWTEWALSYIPNFSKQ